LGVDVVQEIEGVGHSILLEADMVTEPTLQFPLKSRDGL